MKRPLYGSEAEMRGWINDAMSSLRELRDKLDESTAFKSGFHAEITIVVYSKESENPLVTYCSLKDEGCNIDQMISLNLKP
jgi:hypothetical protein